MDAQGFANWIQQNRQQAPAIAGQLMRPSPMAAPPPPPRPTFDPSQGAPPGMGSMGGKPGQFGNSVPNTVGPQYGPSGQPAGKPFTPQASSGNIFAAPERGGQPGNSSQPMGVRNAPNLFGKGPTGGAPAGPPGPQGRDYAATAGPRGATPMGPRPQPINALGPVNAASSYGPQGPRPTSQPGAHPLIPAAGSIMQRPVGIGGVPIPKAGG